MPGPKIPTPGSYLLHPHIPVIGTAQLPQLALKAKNGLNQGPGLNFFLCTVIGDFIITTRGIFGFTIGTEANNPKKTSEPPEAHFPNGREWRFELTRDAGRRALSPRKHRL